MGQKAQPLVLRTKNWEMCQSTLGNGLVDDPVENSLWIAPGFIFGKHLSSEYSGRRG